MTPPLVLIHVPSLGDPRVADYRLVADPARLRARGLFVVEGRLILRAVLADARHRLASVMVSPAALDAVRDVLGDDADLDVFVCPKSALRALVGYDVSRGCLALAHRPPPAHPDDVLTAGPGEAVVVLERVANPDNIGGIFRSALTLGATGVLLSPGCGDPLYRKAVRVSIGATLHLRYAVVADWPGGLARLRARGCLLAALTTRPSATEVGAFAAARDRQRPVALLAGNEGTGLSEDALAVADVPVRIPMAAGADSLNVATAVAIALHCVRSA